MIKNFYRLGKALDGQDSTADYFSPWQNPFPTGDERNLKVIYFPIEAGKVQQYEIEPFKRQLLKQYLYRKPNGANGAPLVPTTFFYPAADGATHLDNLSKMMSRVERALGGNALFFPSPALREEGLSEIKRQLAAFQGEANARYLLTIKIDGAWLGDFEDNVQLFYGEAYNKYREKSAAKNKVCALTYQESEEVWGRVDTLGFTVNDLTFSRSGFDEADSYRMFPVSAEAVRLLEGAKEYAMEKLLRRFTSLEYIILPHFLQEADSATRYAVTKIEKKDNERDVLDFSKVLLNNEQVFHELAEYDEKIKEGVFYDILFFQRSQAQLALKLHLTDLLPSRFAAIFQAKQQVESRYQAMNRLVNNKGEVTPFAITFDRIKRYFSQVIKKETIFHPFFFKLVEAVFYGNQVDERTILSAFFHQIQTDFKQRNESSSRYIIATKEAFALWHFFAALGLFTSKPNINMDKTPSPRTLHEFEAAHTDFFDAPYKKAAFYMGCLVSVLTAAQYKKINSEPFLERLNSLSMDDVELRKLFPVLLDKMRQYEDIEKYNHEYVQALKSEVATILMNPTELGRTEISFAFTAGMVMQKEFTKFKFETAKAQKAATTES